MTKLQINKHLGKVINGVTIGEEVSRDNYQIKVKAICFCGTTFEVYLSNLRNKAKTSCGCTYKASVTNNFKKPLYAILSKMKSRCNNATDKWYHRYGGRGITVCSEWQKFEAFEAWSLANGYGQGLQIDRINNNGNYEPGNCRFVTNKVNSNNRGNNRLVWLEGLILTAAEASNQLGYKSGYVSNLIAGNKNPHFPRLILNPPKA